MKRRTFLTVAAGSAVLLALLAWAFAPRPLEVETASAVIGPFEQTVDEDARTRLVERYVVSTPLAGQLQRLTLREGDAVEAGAVVATLLPAASPMLDARTRSELQARAGAAEAGVAQAASRIAAARVALERARVEQQRSEQLAAQGFVAPTKIDADRLAVRAAASDLQAATEGEHVARHELEQARAALGAYGAAAGGRATGGFALRSPIAGRVLKCHVSSEAPLAAGAPVLEVGDTAKLEIVAELLTTDALAARPGAPVRVERWGGPGVLEARVARIEPAAFTKVSALGVEEQRVLAVIELTSPRERWAALGDGFRVAVRIVTRSEPKVLKLPVSAVFPRPGTVAAGEAAHAVFVIDGGRARLQPVTLAARNGQEAWIAGGLADGATVVVYPPAGLADGARVKARRV